MIGIFPTMPDAYAAANIFGIHKIHGTQVRGKYAEDFVHGIVGTMYAVMHLVEFEPDAIDQAFMEAADSVIILQDYHVDGYFLTADQAGQYAKVLEDTTGDRYVVTGGGDAAAALDRLQTLFDEGRVVSA